MFMCLIFPEQLTVKAQEPLIPTWLYKVVASVEDAVFNCQCDQMQNCEGGCETMSAVFSVEQCWPSLLPGTAHFKFSSQSLWQLMINRLIVD